MLSPISGQAMREQQYEGQKIFVCEQTGGELVPGESLSQIVSSREERLSETLLAELDDHEPTFGVPENERERKLACPCCGGAMDVINYAGDTGVFIDRCGSCGAVWLDAGELERLQAILEQFEQRASSQMADVHSELFKARQQIEEQIGRPATVSRFGFINRMINKMMFGETLRKDLNRFDGPDSGEVDQAA